MRWWLAVALVLGCGDNVVPAPVEPHSGERLKLLWYAYPDGAQEPASTRELYDASRGEVCTIAVWTDGRRRCTAGMPGRDLRGLDPVVVFVDDACARPIGRATARVAMMLRGEWRGRAFVPERRYEVGDVATPPPTRTFERVDGACVEVPVDGRFLYWDLALEHPSSELAEVTQQVAPSAGRLAPVVDTSDDGLVLWRGWYDRELDAACSAARTAPGVVCAPDEVVAVDRFADAGCREPAVVVAGGDPPPRAAVSTADTTWCSSYFAVGDPLAAPVYERTVDGCVAVTLPAGARAFRVGAPIELAPLSQEIRDADRPRFADVVETFGELSSPPRRLFDKQLRTECSSRFAFSFEPRCAPLTGYGTLRVFLTSDCGAQTEVGLVPDATCAPPVTVVETQDQGFAELGAPLTHYGGDSCTELPPPPGFALRALGPHHGSDELAAATLIYEP